MSTSYTKSWGKTHGHDPGWDTVIGENGVVLNKDYFYNLKNGRRLDGLLERKNKPVLPYLRLRSVKSSNSFGKITIDETAFRGGRSLVRATGMSELGDSSSYRWASMPDVKRQAIQQVSAKVRKRLSETDMDVGVALGELKETFGLVGSTAARLAYCYSSIKRRDFRSAFRALNIDQYDPKARRVRSESFRPSVTAANSWLELQFGWKPLLSDIYDASVIAQTGLQFDPKDIAVSATGEASEDFSSKARRWYKKRRGTWAANSTQTATKFCRVREQYYFRVIDPVTRAKVALGLQNPALIAWNLFPLSFVVDWFAPVGSMLNSLSALDGLEFHSGFRSIKTQNSYSQSRSGYLGGNTNLTTLGTASVNAQHDLFERIVLTQAPSFTFFSNNSLDEALNVGKTLSSLALLRVFTT